MAKVVQRNQQETSHYQSIQELTPRSTGLDHIIMNWKWRYWWIPLEKKGPQKQIQLKGQRDYITYYQALPEDSTEDRGTLKGIARSELSPAVKHNKKALGNEEELVVKMGIATKNNKTSIQYKSRATSSKPKHHIACDYDKLRLQ